jgi:putative membrane protein
MQAQSSLVPFIFLWAVNTLSLWAASMIFPSAISFHSPSALWISGLVLGLVNAFVKPILLVLTLPVTVLTLGLFILVLNGLMLMLVAWLVPGFHISGLWAGVGIALFVSVFTFLVNSLIGR